MRHFFLLSVGFFFLCANTILHLELSINKLVRSPSRQYQITRNMSSKINKCCKFLIHEQDYDTLVTYQYIWIILFFIFLIFSYYFFSKHWMAQFCQIKETLLYFSAIESGKLPLVRSVFRGFHLRNNPPPQKSVLSLSLVLNFLINQ